MRIKLSTPMFSLMTSWSTSSVRTATIYA
jgi:hypothetical protein